MFGKDLITERAAAFGVASLLQGHGHEKEAESLFRSFMPDTAQVEPSLFAPMSGLASIMMRRGRFAEAKVALEWLLPNTIEVLANRQHPLIYPILESLGTCCLGLGQNEEAERYFKEALAIDGSGAPYQDDFCFRSHAVRGMSRCLRLLGRYQEGEIFAQNALSRLNSCWPRDHRLEVSLLEDLTECLMKQGKSDLVEGHLQLVSELKDNICD